MHDTIEVLASGAAKKKNPRTRKCVKVSIGRNKTKASVAKASENVHTHDCKKEELNKKEEQNVHKLWNTVNKNQNNALQTLCETNHSQKTSNSEKA